jgi:hypothetical protein
MNVETFQEELKNTHILGELVCLRKVLHAGNADFSLKGDMEEVHLLHLTVER